MLVLLALGAAACPEPEPGTPGGHRTSAEETPELGLLLEQAENLGLDVRSDAFLGLPSAVREASVRYLLRAAELTRARAPGAAPPTVAIQRVLNHSAFRTLADPQGLDVWDEARLTAEKERAGSERAAREPFEVGYPYTPAVTEVLEHRPVPLHWLPGSQSLESLLVAAFPDASSPSSVLDGAASHGLSTAHALCFDPARQVTGTLSALVPTPERGVFSAQANPLLLSYVHPFAVGKVIARGEALEEALRHLERASRADRPFWARCDAVRVSPAVLLVRWTLPDEPARVDWAFPFADANGAARTGRPAADPHLGSWFENEVELAESDLRFGRHSLLKIPVPSEARADPSQTESAPFDPARLRATLNREQVCVLGDLLGESAPFLVVRKAPSWRPLQEDIRIDRVPRFDGEGGEPLALLVSEEILPEPLLGLLSAFYGVPGSAARPTADELLELAELRAPPVRASAQR